MRLITAVVLGSLVAFGSAASAQSESSRVRVKKDKPAKVERVEKKTRVKAEAKAEAKAEKVRAKAKAKKVAKKVRAKADKQAAKGEKRVTTRRVKTTGAEGKQRVKVTKKVRRAGGMQRAEGGQRARVKRASAGEAKRGAVRKSTGTKTRVKRVRKAR